MKYGTKYVAIVSAVLLGSSSVAAVAQATTSEAGSGYVTQDDDKDFPWGLLGLLGLAGLLGRKRDDRQSARNESTTGSR